MCKKLKEIHNLSPERILSTYHNKEKPTIDTIHILCNMQIKFSSVDFTKLEHTLFLQGNDTILGMAVSEKDELNILYSKTLDEQMKNYVLAHELGHCCLHLPATTEFHVEMKTDNDIYSENRFFSFLSHRQIKKKELEADIFAASLLLPTKKLINYLLTNSNPTIESLANDFNVPECLIRIKLSSLNRRYV